MKPTELMFSNCTLAMLEDWFGLHKQYNNASLNTWLSSNAEIHPFESENIKNLTATLADNSEHWNETDLSMHFIGPMFSVAQFTVRYRFNLFAQRNIEAVVDDIKLFGRVDEMIATGFREPKIPYFAFNAYKRKASPDLSEGEENNDPAGQCLAAMLAAQALNHKKETVYGCYVIGATWYFMVLEGKHYAMSNSFDGRDIDEALQILRILKALKEVCMQRTAHLVEG